ncbi:LPD29 domain-containing protein [Achromobacter ruhlandii]|uniref:LPD29 domain-containing protein n=1 Tax=Achromobacter ruhlandii TaxID=72557 RepID=UPI003B9F47C5
MRISLQSASVAGLDGAAAILADAGRLAACDSWDASSEVSRIRARSHLRHLEAGDDSNSGWLAARNIRAELAKFYPRVRFFVRRDGFGKVLVRWSDGPVTVDVQARVTPFAQSPVFRAAFGGVDSIECRRDLSDALLRRAIATVWAQLADVMAPSIAKPAPSDLGSECYTAAKLGGFSFDLRALIFDTAARMPGL